MMRARLAVFLIVGVAAVFALLFARQLRMSRSLPHEAYADKVLKLLTYSSFVSSHGPGPSLIREFEKTCGCKVDVISVSDAGLLLERLKLGGADLVIGLDQLLLPAARQEFAWRSLEVEDTDWEAAVAALATDEFIPFDWSPLTFVYRKSAVKNPPRKFDDLLRAEFKKQFSVQDPRASSPGLQFYNWVRTLKDGKATEFLQAFKENLFSVAPSWSFTYGLFQKGEVKFAFSYVTSLAYHWGVDKDRDFDVLSFPEGHPVQVEFAAVPASCQQCELAATFVEHIVQKESQKTIMESNFMFPALKGVVEGTLFSELPKLNMRTVTEGKDFHDWDQVFPR